MIVCFTRIQYNNIRIPIRLPNLNFVCNTKIISKWNFKILMEQKHGISIVASYAYSSVINSIFIDGFHLVSILVHLPDPHELAQTRLFRDGLNVAS